MNQSSLSKINLLPEHIIDQIKAGEVIERPSTLIKEIIENSVDANSTKIEIHLRENGLELISIIDNGFGISHQELPLAFCRHATSKINHFEDLYHLSSYGFRGEALASIASISRVTCESQTKNGWGLIKISGGETLTYQHEAQANTETGTQLFIKDLFYNTPVRMKFIQSKTSEKNHLKKILNSFLLTQYQIEFSIKWDDKEKEYYQPRTNPADRIKDVLFKNKDSQLVITQQAYDGVCFKIFLSQDSSRGNAHKNHFLFINDRFIQDIKLHKIILNAASSLWPEGETGHYVAYLDIPSDEVDVNIHPNKTVVKLFKAPRVFSIISGTIRHELTSRQQLHTAASPKASELPLEVSTDSFSNVEYRPVDFSMKDQVEDYFDNIHQQPHPSLDKPSESGLVFDFHDYSLYKINDHLFILNKEKILIYHLMKILCSQSLKENAVPLLVSRPIKVSQKVQTQTNDFLQSLGFEIDHLDATTVAVRTFPKDLQSYPYLEIIEYLLEHKISSFDQLDFSHFKFNTYNNSLISDILSKIAITELIEQNILQQMTQDQIKKYYAK